MCWYNPLFPLKISTELLYNDNKVLGKFGADYILESGAFEDLVKFPKIPMIFIGLPMIWDQPGHRSQLFS